MNPFLDKYREALVNFLRDLAVHLSPLHHHELNAN
jgi:hypothetical protein